MTIDPNKQLPGGTDTINERFFDALVRHQIGLLRLSGSIRNDIFKLLDASEVDIANKIRLRLSNHKGLTTPRDIQRLELLLKSIRAPRINAWRDVNEVWVAQLTELARSEPRFTDGALKTVVPVVLDTVLPSAALLRAIVRQRPFQGKTLRGWARNVEVADLARIEAQIKIGMVQGESSAAIARRVVGTKTQGGRDGVTAITRRQAAAVTRTAVIGISNMARREYYRANEELFTEELYVATLDARTTPICRSLDGKTFPIAVGPMPPLHFNCRSLRIAVIDGKVLGQRPARAFTERQLLREFAKKQGISSVTSRAQLPRGTKGLFDDFRQGRIRELTGTVPAKVSYGTWLGRQSAAFQDDILGKTKGALFRRGGLKLDKFVNRAGDELTLSQLARSERDAFIAAGLDPEDFI